MLQSLNELGYAVEWRVINAAEYGMPQRRRRVFFLGYHKSTQIYKKIQENEKDWIEKSGVIAKAFPIHHVPKFSPVPLSGDLVEISKKFNLGGKKSPFENTGLQIDGKVFTSKTMPLYEGERTVLGDVLVERIVGSEFYIDEKDKEKWEYLKGAKQIKRVSAEGFEYNLSLIHI